MPLKNFLVIFEWHIRLKKQEKLLRKYVYDTQLIEKTNTSRQFT